MKFADRMLRVVAALAVTLVCAGFDGAPAAAQSGFGPDASVTDLRVGVHPDKTRIVIETDSAAPYVMEPGQEEIVVRVDAASAAEAVTAKSPDLIWVKVEPTQTGTDVRIQLKRPVDVKPMVLKRPDRIVLDLVARTEPAETTPLPAPVVLPEEEPAPVKVAEAEPEPEPAVEPEPLPEEAPAPEPEPSEAETGEMGTELTAELPEIEGEIEPMPAEGSELELAIEESEGEPEAAPYDSAEAPSDVAPSEPAGGPSLRTYLLGATALVLLAVWFWIQRRLRADKKREFPPLPEEDEAPFATPERAVEVAEGPDSGESVFDVEPDSLRPEGEEAPSLRQPEPEPADDGERRILSLEKRIEELSEAKDRLERQIAAQTEELRVQRAAIARTQRVLRSIAPKDEDGSEPLVRG